MSFTSQVRSYFLKPDPSGILVVESIEKGLDPFRWLQENKALLEENILRYGGVLLRNFEIPSISDFNRFVQILCPTLLDYTYRSTPRTKLGGKIYTATEYPSDRTIPLHNENSYSRSWPQKIIFFSSIVSSEGGETPVADSRNVYQKIATEIKEKFKRTGVLYIRNYSQGVDLNWQEVFQTDSKEDVDHYCKENAIDTKWQAGTPELTTRQVCQAIATHPVTHEEVWFNQAHLFHVSALDENMRHSLINELGESKLPRNAFYGDGTPLEIEVLEHIRDVYEQEKIKFTWQKKDIMILDNLLMAHGREPYKGERKIAVAMS